MADQVMTAATEMSAIIPEKWSTNFYDTLLAELPFESLISRDWEGEIQDLGDTVNISQVPEFDEADLLPEEGKADAQAKTIVNLQLVINKRAARDFIVTKRAQLQSISAMDKLQNMAIFAVMKKINSEIIAAIVPNAATPDHQIPFDSGTTLALADILEGKELLDDQNVPESDRSMVLGSAQMNDIFNITGFTSSDFLLSGAPLQTGQLPSGLLGFRPAMSTTVGNVVYQFHRSFMTIAVQQGMNVEVFNQGNEGKRSSRVNVDSLFGLKQLDGLRVVSIS